MVNTAPIASRPGRNGASNLGDSTRLIHADEANYSPVTTWLHSLGLVFNPFEPLDASTDKRLAQYYVDQSTFETVWGDWLSFVFAPPGGGKTALRVWTAQSCWAGQETNHPFPIVYIPDYDRWPRLALTLDDHLASLCRAAASQLLVAVAVFPHWFWRLDRASQAEVRQALAWDLPGPLERYLALCRAARSVRPLLDRLAPTFPALDLPDAESTVHLCAALGAAIPAAPPPAPSARWQRLVTLLRGSLGFPALYLLVDGLDSVEETQTSSQALLSGLQALLAVAPRWAEHGVFIKSFLPQDTAPLLRERNASLMTVARSGVIEWDMPSLADLVHYRLRAASHGAFDSLNAIGSPALPQLEPFLAELIPPRPRLMLSLCQALLRAHVDREGPSGILEAADLDAVLSSPQRNKGGRITLPMSLALEAV